MFRLPRLEICCAALFIATTASPLDAATSGSVRFRVMVEPDRKGTVLCALYHREDLWLTRSAFRNARATPTGQWVTCTFDRVPPGVYGAAALHDEDGDERMKTNFLGIPLEGYTTSRDAQDHGLYPDWEDAAFRYRATGIGTVTGSMKY